MKKVKLSGLPGEHTVWYSAGNWCVNDGRWAPLYTITHVPTGKAFLVVPSMDKAKSACDICAEPSNEREATYSWALEKLLAIRAAGINATMPTGSNARSLDLPAAIAYVCRKMDGITERP